LGIHFVNRTYATAWVPAGSLTLHSPRLITLQRAVTGVRPGERVIFLNRCSFDLRWDNLYVQGRQEAREAVAKYRASPGIVATP